MPETWKNKEEGQDQAMVVVENQDGVYVKGLSCHLAQSEEEALNLLFEVIYFGLILIQQWIDKYRVNIDNTDYSYWSILFVA